MDRLGRVWCRHVNALWLFDQGICQVMFDKFTVSRIWSCWPEWLPTVRCSSNSCWRGNTGKKKNTPLGTTLWLECKYGPVDVQTSHPLLVSLRARNCWNTLFDLFRMNLKLQQSWTQSCLKGVQRTVVAALVHAFDKFRWWLHPASLQWWVCSCFTWSWSNTAAKIGMGWSRNSQSLSSNLHPLEIWQVAPPCPTKFNLQNSKWLVTQT